MVHSNFHNSPLLPQRSQSIGSRAGDPCYIMCGNLMKYEPAYLNYSSKKSHNRVGLNKDMKVSVKTAFRNVAAKNLQYSKSRYLKKEQEK